MEKRYQKSQVGKRERQTGWEGREKNEKRIPFGPVVKVLSEVLALLCKEPNNFKRHVCFTGDLRDLLIWCHVPQSHSLSAAEVRGAPPWEKDTRKGPGLVLSFNQRLELNPVLAKRGGSRAQENLPWFWFVGGRIRKLHSFVSQGRNKTAGTASVISCVLFFF